MDTSLSAMRTVLSQRLHQLITETRDNPKPEFAAQAVAQLVDVWVQSALAMIAAAVDASTHAPHSPAVPAPPATASSLPDELRASMLASLRLIIDGARANEPDVDDQCQRFADTFAQCFRDAIAGAYLKMATVRNVSMTLLHPTS